MNKRKSEKKAVCLLFALYTVIGVVIMFTLKSVLPFPIAEIAAVTYYFFTNGKIIFGLITLAVIIGLVYFLINVLWKEDIPVFGKYYITVLCSVDFITHIVVFFLSDGYQWNYLVSAVLDFILVFTVFVKVKKENVSELSDGTEG